MSIFFHPTNERGCTLRRREITAKTICLTCPVRVECAEYAIRAREPYGVWGNRD
ncbi:MAG: WhiB family transcriptional regulator [Actinobacteria bacterium]|nr:WhiB family transcriptional regulator [Actinomycetota bacterium]